MKQIGTFIAERTPGRYGFLVRDTENGEWELAVMLSPGQGGATAIGVVFAQCDQGMGVATGDAGGKFEAEAVKSQTKYLVMKAGRDFRHRGLEELIDWAVVGIMENTFK